MENKSTFMVFDRETYAQDGGCAGSYWEDDHYDKIMEFKPGSDRARMNGYLFAKSWCRPLSMQDFIDKKIAVTFDSEDEQRRFLRECDKAGIERLGDRPVCDFRTLKTSESLTCGFFVGEPNCLGYANSTWHADHGVQVVPFSSFFFPSEPYPRREIHITSDGLTTHAVYKLDGKVIKRSKATCNPNDKYDYEVGARLAMYRLIGKDDGALKPAEQKTLEITCGKGDICVGSSGYIHPDRNILYVSKNDTIGPVGAIKYGIAYNDPPLLKVTFTNPISVDVWIQVLKNIKENMRVNPVAAQKPVAPTEV